MWPMARKFGGRLALSPYVYKRFHLRLGFNLGKRQCPPGCDNDLSRGCEP